MSPRVPSYWGLNRWNQGKLRHLRWSPGDADPGLHSRRTSKPRGAASVSTATRTALRRTLRERQRGCCTGRGGPPLRRRWRRRRPPTRVENGVSTSRISTFLPTDPRGITLVFSTDMRPERFLCLFGRFFRLHTGGLGARTPASTQQRRPAVEERRARAQHFSRFARYSDIIKRTTRRRSRQTNGGARRWTISKDSTIARSEMALSEHTARKPGWCALWPFRLSERGVCPTEHHGPCTK